MAPRIVIIGGGSLQWVPKLLIDIVNMPSLPRPRSCSRTSTPSRCPRWPTSSTTSTARRASGITVDHDRPPRGARRRRLRRRQHLDRRVRQHAPRPRDPRAVRHQAVGRRHRRARAASCGPCATSRCSSTSHATWKTLCPDAWMLNLTNPMTTLCRAVTRETIVKTVGLCHEITGAQFTLSQLLDVDFRDFDFEVVGVNHLPIITALRHRRRRRVGPRCASCSPTREARRRADLPARRDRREARRRRGRSSPSATSSRATR